MVRTAAITLLIVLLGGNVGAQSAPKAQAETNSTAFFEQKIRPLLIENCYSCHSASAKTSQGGLQLDTRDSLLKGGGHGPALVVGQPEKSLLLRAVGYQDKTLQMPPKGKLAPAQIAALTEWVKIGAPDPRAGGTSGVKPFDLEKGRKHWSFQPLQKTAPPAVKNLAWPKTPIDRFVLAKLEAKGLLPNRSADRRTLIRRAYFDMIGLPPTPELVNAFLADTSPNAWNKVVDALLASPHYGERWGRHWLDLARFAESHGYEQDYDRPYAYHYRDFVIRALNEDLPYDQFVRWQLAGDEFAPDNPMALMATGFLAAGTHATQITKSQVEKERYDELDDMLSTTGTTFLGLTIGCARCHNHKYDPISNRDYYRMLSTFTTTVRSEMNVNMAPEEYRRAKETFDKAHAPLTEALAKYENEQLPLHLTQWLVERKGKPLPASWQILAMDTTKSEGGAALTLQEDGSYLASGKNPDSDTYLFTARTTLKNITCIRLEAMQDPSLVKGGPGRATNGNFDLTDLRVTAAPANGQGKPIALTLVRPRATFEQSGLPISAVLDSNPKSGWAVDPQFGKDQAAAFEIESPVGFDGGTILTFILKFEGNTGHNIGRPRLAVSAEKQPLALNAPAIPESVAALLARPDISESSLTDKERKTLLAWYCPKDDEWKILNSAVQAHLALAPQPPIQKVLISSEGVPAVRTHTQGGDFLEQTYFLKRGDPNQKGDVATQSFLTVLIRDPQEEKHWQIAPPKEWRTSYRRRSLANWITDTQEGAGALLARVIVNRLWQHHFGRGIVATPSDFGTQGAPPTHPELLDWLATELIRDGWKLKPLHRLMLTSATYLQSTAVTPAQIKRDPDNRLLGRRMRQRLEAEAIRDSMLSISGQLDPAMFGPGTLDETHKRRSIYFFVKRSKLIPTMMLFDAPNALQSLPARASTIVAPQALMLMNSPLVRTYAAALAQRVAPNPGASPTEAVKSVYLLALSRPPTAQEQADALTFMTQQAASYKAAGQANPQQLALTDICQVVFGLNEFIYIE